MTSAERRGVPRPLPTSLGIENIPAFLHDTIDQHLEVSKMDKAFDAEGAHEFLQRLQASLDTLPVPSVLTKELDRAVLERDPKQDLHLFRREAVFVNQYVVPRLFNLIQHPDYLGPDHERARRTLRNESLRGMEAYTIETGARLSKFPFI